MKWSQEKKKESPGRNEKEKKNEQASNEKKSRRMIGEGSRAHKRYYRRFHCDGAFADALLTTLSRVTL